MAIHLLRIACAAVVLSATSAVALELPKYDVEAGCSKLWNAAARNTCIADEQRAYDLLNMTWNQYTESSQRQCDDTSKVIANYNYTALLDCSSAWKIQDDYQASMRRRDKFRYRDEQKSDRDAVDRQENKPVFYPNVPPPSDYVLAPVRKVRTIRVHADPSAINAK